MTSRSLWTKDEIEEAERWDDFIKNNNILSSIHNCPTLDLISLLHSHPQKIEPKTFFLSRFFWWYFRYHCVGIAEVSESSKDWDI